LQFTDEADASFGGRTAAVDGDCFEKRQIEARKSGIYNANCARNTAIVRADAVLASAVAQRRRSARDPQRATRGRREKECKRNTWTGGGQ
jgi:hypothetical protein